MSCPKYDIPYLLLVSWTPLVIFFNDSRGSTLFISCMYLPQRHNDDCLWLSFITFLILGELKLSFISFLILSFINILIFYEAAAALNSWSS